MKTAMRKTLFVAGTAVILLVLLGAKKVKQLKDTFDKMTIRFKWADNWRFGLNETKFSMDVEILNPTDDDFFVYGDVVATLNKIGIVYNGIRIAIANVNYNQIEVPAHLSIILKNIPVVIDNQYVIPNIDNLPAFLAKCSVIGYVDVLGTEFVIKS